MATKEDTLASSQQWTLYLNLTSTLRTKLESHHTESNRKRHHDSVYWFDLKIAHDNRLVFLADSAKRHLTL